MKNVLIASALASVSAFTFNAANAADLPSRKAAPANYVKICDAYGSGYFFIPGTDTCLKIGGYVRFEMQYTPGRKIYNVATGAVSQVAGSQDTTGMETRGRVELDARTPTSMGTVRTVVRMRAANTSGNRRQGGAANFATTYPGANASNTAITLERAYVEWAGFQFGVQGSEWHNLPPGNQVGFIGDMGSGWPNGIMALSYTATFGNGFKAIVSLEDRTYGTAHGADFSTSGAFPVAGGTAYQALGLAAPPTASNGAHRHSPLTGYYLIGVLDYSQKWGGVRVGGLIGNDSTSSNPANLAGNGAAANPLVGTRTYSSWAANATVNFKLPMLAAGDELWLHAAYGHGALGYVTGDSFNTFMSDSNNRRVLGGVIQTPSNLQVTSAVGANPTAWGSTKSFILLGMFTHFWTPQLRSHFLVNNVWITPPAATASAGTQLGKASLFEVKANLIYSPVRNFDIGAELAWGRMSSSIQNPTAAFVAAGRPGLNESGWTTKFRVQRGF